jgi:hypothetical protein
LKASGLVSKFEETARSYHFILLHSERKDFMVKRLLLSALPVKYLKLRLATLAAVLAMLPATLVGQQSRILVVNGKEFGAAVLQSNGRSYVDVETVAQAMNASVTLLPDRVILTLPGGSASSENALPPGTISREFASSALRAVALMRDWRVAIEMLISFHLPVTGTTYFQDAQDRAEEALRQAGVLASTDPDHEAYQLLQNESSNMASWAGNAIAARQALNATGTMSPDVLKNDAELQKISDCGNRLGTMLAGLHYADIPSCH